MIRNRLGLFLLAVSLIPLGTVAANDRDELVAQIDSLKGLHLPADEEGQNALRKRLADVWSFVEEHKAEALPLFIERLRAELDTPQRDNFFLINLGCFLAFWKEARALDASWLAIEKVSSDDALVRAFPNVLFSWAHHLSMTGDARILPILDRLFLMRDYLVVIPAHSLQLTPSLVRVFLYGAAGAQSEPHLLASLEANPELAGRVMSVLAWIGSERSLGAAKRIIDTGVCDDSLLSAAVVLVRFGGPQERDILMRVSGKKCDGEIQEQLRKMARMLKSRSFGSIMKEFKGIEKLPDDEIKKRLRLMYERYGKDRESKLLPVLRSGLPARFLIDQLVAIRSRMLHRVSDEALYDVRATNQLIEALTYRKDYLTSTGH